MRYRPNRRGGGGAYLLGGLVGAVAGAVSALLGSLVTIVLAVFGDLSFGTLFEVLSFAGVLGSLPVVLLLGAAAGAVVGLLLARLFA